jgi:hypothetical protein
MIGAANINADTHLLKLESRPVTGVVNKRNRTRLEAGSYGQKDALEIQNNKMVTGLGVSKSNRNIRAYNFNSGTVDALIMYQSPTDGKSRPLSSGVVSPKAI